MIRSYTYRATFADGAVRNRISHRVYTHAWRVRWSRVGSIYPVEHVGFSCSEDSARLTLASASDRELWAPGCHPDIEIVLCTQSPL